MAGSDDAFMGRLSGRIGNLVVYQMYGKTVVRIRPASRTKKTSPELKASQNVFKTVIGMLKRLKHILRFGFAAEAVNRSAWNAAVSANLSRYRQVEDKSISNWLQLSAGRLAQASDWQLNKDENGQLQLSWENGAEANGRGGDKLIVFIVPDADQGLQAVMEITAASRFSKQALVELDNPYKRAAAEVFTAFISAYYNGDRKPDGLSESVWVGRIEA
ncbi:MAG: DUF6266 family protein [Bacteroidetes bacterium]|jgi:hypothetical protein|nr:DUF6266 family protein [Bacteroidota bacterium]